MTGNEVAIYRTMDLPERQQYALVVAKANALLGKALRAQTPEETAARAFLIMETGDMLGLHPAAALAGINVIEGKPSLSSGLMSALIRGAGHKLHLSETGTVEEGTYKVTATLVREDDPDHPFSSTWSPHRAARAELCSYRVNEATGIWEVKAQSREGKPLPWQLYTESLCKSRSISEVARDGGQDVLLGLRYTDEELLAGIAEGDGQAIEATVEDEPRDRPARQRRATNGRQGTKRKAAPVDAPSAPEEAPSAPQEADKPAEDIVDAEVVNEAPSEAQDEAQAMAANDAAEEDDRIERERIAADQEAEQRRREYAEAEEHAKDRKGESPVTPEQVEELRARQEEEVARQHAHLQATKSRPENDEAARAERQRALLDERLAAERDAIDQPIYRDTVTGQEFESQEKLDEAIKARHADEKTRQSLASWDNPDDAPALASAYDVAAGEEFEQESPNYERLMQACVNQVELKDMYQRAVGRGDGTTEFRRAVTERKHELPET